MADAANSVTPQDLFAAIACARGISPAAAAAEVNNALSTEKVPFAEYARRFSTEIQQYREIVAAAERDRLAAEGVTADGLEQQPEDGAPATPRLRLVSRSQRAAGPVATEQRAPVAQAPRQQSLREALDHAGVHLARVLASIDGQAGISFTFVPALAGPEHSGWVVDATILDIQDDGQGPALAVSEDGRVDTIQILPSFRFSVNALGAGLDHVLTEIAAIAQQGQQQ